MDLSCILSCLVRRVLKINSGGTEIPGLTIKALIAFQRLKEITLILPGVGNRRLLLKIYRICYVALWGS